MPKPNTSPYLFFPEGFLPRELLGDPALLSATSGPRGNTAYTTFVINNLIQHSTIPLFKYNPFSECLTPSEWESIDLACRLASYFVTDPNMLPFWMRVFCGKLEREWSQDEETYYLDFTPPTDKEEFERLHNETMKALMKLGRHAKFTKMSGEEIGASAVSKADGMFARGEKHAYAKAYLSSAKDMPCIGIHTDIIKHISKLTPKASSSKRAEDSTSSKSKPPQWRDTRSPLTEDQEQQFYDYLRFQFTLACSFIDQLVALFFHVTHSDQDEPKLDLDRQPFYSEDIVPESDPLALRYSWQMFALGCKVEQWHNSYPLDPRGKIKEKVDVGVSTFLHTYYTKSTGLDREGRHTTLLPMDWIVRWFLQPIEQEDFHRWCLELSTRDLPMPEGRPKLSNAPMLVCKETKVPVDGKKDLVELWSLEKYDHEKLAAMGGFDMVEEQGDLVANDDLETPLEGEQEEGRGRSRKCKPVPSTVRSLAT